MLQFAAFNPCLNILFMPLSKNQIKHLRSLAHNLKPVILVGQNGVTDNVINELNGTTPVAFAINEPVDEGTTTEEDTTTDDVKTARARKTVLRRLGPGSQ